MKDEKQILGHRQRLGRGARMPYHALDADARTAEDERRITMPRYINADKLIRRLQCEVESCKNPRKGSALGFKMAIYIAQTLPDEQVVPREEAEWVFISPYYPYEVGKYMCSRCKSEIRADEKYKMKFCFSCGAKMKGE